MKCPDCGSRLADVMFGADERAMRCFRCGGFWIDSATVNKLSSQKLTAWRRISINPVWLQGGKGVCPLDNTMLTRYIGGVIPMDMIAMRCVRCGKWWFPGDSLFNFKPALEEKVRYLGISGNLAEINKIGLPLMVAVLLILGVVAGVSLVKIRTQEAVPAATPARNVKVTYVGQGQAMVTFLGTGKPDAVKYRLNKGGEWGQAPVYCTQGGCQAQMMNLEYGKEYQVVVEGEEYRFVAK